MVCTQLSSWIKKLDVSRVGHKLTTAIYTMGVTVGYPDVTIPVKEGARI